MAAELSAIHGGGGGRDVAGDGNMPDDTSARGSADPAATGPGLGAIAFLPFAGGVLHGPGGEPRTGAAGAAVNLDEARSRSESRKRAKQTDHGRGQPREGFVEMRINELEEKIRTQILPAIGNLENKVHYTHDRHNECKDVIDENVRKTDELGSNLVSYESRVELISVKVADLENKTTGADFDMKTRAKELEDASILCRAAHSKARTLRRR